MEVGVKKKEQQLILENTKNVDEDALYNRVSEIIEYRKSRAGAYANREVTLMYWEVGEHINSVVLDGGRAAYGKNILSTLSTKLSWSHFCEIMRIKTEEGRLSLLDDILQIQKWL